MPASLDAFNFVFTLFGLLLGFTLTEVLGGVGKTIKAAKRVHVGWLTPLLALFVMMDVLSFWQLAWVARALIPVNYATLMGGLAITGTYYLAASLVFPEELAAGVDLDVHYLEVRRRVLGGVWLCNTVPNTLLMVVHRPPALALVAVAVYWVLVGVAVATSNRIANLAALLALVACYLLTAIVTVTT